MNGYGLDRLRFHIDVPQFQGEVVPGEDVPATGTEFDVIDGGEDFREEGLLFGVFFFFEC